MHDLAHRRTLSFVILILVRLILSNKVRRQVDGAIKCIWQTPVATTQHHSTDDDFTEDGVFAREGSKVGWVAERQSDVAVSRDDFEEDGEDGEGLVR